MSPVQNLRIGGRSSRSEYQFVMQSVRRDEMRDWARKLTDAMAADPHFTDVTNDLQNNAIQVTLHVDRDKAASLGITADRSARRCIPASARGRSRRSTAAATPTAC